MIEKKELPQVAEVTKALEVAAGSSAAAKYLCVRFEEKVFALKLHKTGNEELLENANRLQGQLNAFAKYVDCQLSANSDAWRGKSVALTSAFEKLQASLANEGAKAIEDKAKENEYTMHIAVGQNGEVLRAYVAESIDLERTQVFEEEADTSLDVQQAQGI